MININLLQYSSPAQPDRAFYLQISRENPQDEYLSSLKIWRLPVLQKSQETLLLQKI